MHHPMLDIKIPVLDDGFIRLVDVMGDDEDIVQAARVSYGKGTRKITEDRGLIRYLMRHRHTTPFEMCEMKIHVRVPMDCWRQWIRHRTANVNEYSTRYSVAIDSMQKTAPHSWRIQNKDNKQGSKGALTPAESMGLSDDEDKFHKQAESIYHSRLALGVAREQARKDLPLSTYTEAYWKMDLHNLLHFLSLRMDSHAQQEIRTYANIIGEELVAPWVPYTWEAFLDYRLNAMVLTGLEIDFIKTYVQAHLTSPSSVTECEFANKRERAEFADKLNRLGVVG